MEFHPTPQGLIFGLQISETLSVIRIRNPATTPQVDVVLGQPNSVSVNSNYYDPPTTSPTTYNNLGFWNPGSVVVGSTRRECICY